MRRRRFLEVALLTIAGIFLLLHAVHLKADFPNNSPWVDWAKYTDEGWYGDAAIRFYLRGAWHLPGDFNPAVALPVWPLLEAALFGLTGVSIVAARGLAVAVFEDMQWDVLERQSHQAEREQREVLHHAIRHLGPLARVYEHRPGQR